MSSKTFRVSLSEEQVIFLSEVMVIEYVANRTSNTLATLCLCNDPLASQMEDSLRITLHDLLKGPLESCVFRRRFYDHFSSHPDDAIREIGWEWMQNQLTWED